MIKYGGAAMTDPELREDFARDVVLLKYVGLNPIIVHGGGPDITAYMKRLNMPVEFIGGLRVSDADTVEVAKMVLVGKVNKDIVMRINRHGQPAVGLSGDDGQLFRVSTMEGPGGEDIGFVGKIERVDTGVISHIAEDYIPVIASVGADRGGRSHNVNADEAAGAIARALGAYKVMFLTDVAGWLRDAGRPGQRDLRVRRRRGRGRARTDAGRDAAEAAGVRGRDPRRRDLRAHHRRPAAALAAARAVHGRRHRHEGEARLMSLAPTYARYPVEFVSGSGCVLTDSEGDEYLDFLSGIAVNNVGHCHPQVVAAVQEQVGRLMHVSNLFTTEPNVRLAERLVRALASGGACSSATPARRPTRPRSSSCARRARAATSSSPTARSTAARTARCRATPQESKQAPFAPLVPGFRAVRRPKRSRTPSTT